jgi:hypothetical protein
MRISFTGKRSVEFRYTLIGATAMGNAGGGLTRLQGNAEKRYRLLLARFMLEISSERSRLFRSHSERRAVC